jgi:hypothetical protein
MKGKNMTYFKFKKDAQETQNPGSRSSFISGAVPEDKRWNPGEGRYTIRILPPWSEEGLIAKKIIAYYKAGSSQMTFISPDFFEQGTCPFVHAYKQIRHHIQGDKGGYDRHKDDITMVRPVNRWYANVVVMEEMSKGSQVWGFGKNAYEQIMALLEGGSYGDISDPEEGTNLMLQLTPGQYGLTPILHAMRDITPLANKDWLDQIYDLDNIWVQPSIEEVKKAYLSCEFKTWTPRYLYEKEDNIRPTHAPTPRIESPVDSDDIPWGSPNTSGQPLDSKVDEVTGAPQVPPTQIGPPSVSADRYDEVLSLEEKIKARAAANK